VKLNEKAMKITLLLLTTFRRAWLKELNNIIIVFQKKKDSRLVRKIINE